MKLLTSENVFIDITLLWNNYWRGGILLKLIIEGTHIESKVIPTFSARKSSAWHAKNLSCDGSPPHLTCILRCSHTRKAWCATH